MDGINFLDDIRSGLFNESGKIFHLMRIIFLRILYLMKLLILLYNGLGLIVNIKNRKELMILINLIK